MRGNSHVRCEVGENLEITSKDYLSLYPADISLPTEAERKAEMFTQEDMQDSCRKQKRGMYTDILSVIGNSGMDKRKTAGTGS